ncbi:dTDP-4-dehydrorhamnose reductase [Micromonospora olivasterospora]|uniref:dTDP-4-dehydrorhamnose reductase n=1 Tax=Micromonospora olivasterospora TaxID=1880 RepID=A0A562IEX8_MICOL|nr:dTDP-4-dehydrorhamnose reductase [Micromonospora olivasterospora]
MTVLVVGASGYLGGEVCRQAVAAGERVVGTYHANPVDLPGGAARRLDVTDRAAVRALVAAVRPAVVVSTPYRYDDWTVTADGAAHVAYAAAEVGARLVHLSSDALHAGRPEAYADDEPPSPVFPYGAAKAAAETAVRLVGPAAALVRTSLIVGGERSRQIQLCLDALAGRASLFTDEVRCPVHVADLAAAVLELAATDYAGPLNVAGPRPSVAPRWGCWWPAATSSTRPG